MVAADDPAAPFRALCDAPRGRPLALLHSCGEGPIHAFDSPVDALTVPADACGGAWEALAGFLERHRARPCVGWLGFDLRDATEALPRHAPDDLPLPILHVAAHERMATWPALGVPPPPPVPPARDLRLHLPRAEYVDRVARVVEHIRAGDVFQANLTQPVTGRFDGDPRALFWRLCAVSPAPFAAYVESGAGEAVLSASPEEFLRAAEGRLRTRPIKGTRPRGEEPGRDRELLAELLESGKDRAELAMIVDLMRNDLGGVAVTGSVQVGPFPEYRSFAQVHHLFATVTATLDPRASLVDLLRATFPPGSCTGAPKLRVMEILEELEVVRRGVYTGAIGRFGPGPSMHLNVAIRTMVVRGGTVRFNVGGGVTAQSDPATEWEETLHKASGIERALQARVGGDGRR